MLKHAVGLLAALIFSSTSAFGQAVLADGELLRIPQELRADQVTKECGPYVLLNPSPDPRTNTIIVVLKSPSPMARLMAPIIPLEILTVIIQERARPWLRWISGSDTRQVRGRATLWISQKDLKEALCLPQGRPV